MANKSFRELRALARIQTRGSILTLFCVALVWGLITGGISGILEYMELAMLASLVFLLFAGIMEWGAITNQNAMFNNNLATFGNGFAGFKFIGPAFITYFLMSIFIFLWSLLLIIPGIIKSYSYACTMYIRHEDPSKDPNQCITESRELMNGHKGRLFLYDLHFFLLCILSMFLLFIPLIWIVPRYMQVRYNFYKDLKGQGASTNVTPDSNDGVYASALQPQQSLQPDGQSQFCAYCGKQSTGGDFCAGCGGKH